MKMRATYELPFKRRREGKTDYHKRLGLLKSKKLRLVIRRSTNNIKAQIIEYNKDGDKILVSSSSSELKKLGWDYPTGNIPSAYLVGLLVGKKALKNKIEEVIVDMGLYRNIKGSRINSVLKGVLDAGLKVPHDPEILPSEDRIKGKHIINYYNQQKERKNLFIKSNPMKMSEMFEKVKSSITKGV
ncbi:MAG: 50S ribosomal protein L18 [Candidatus Aenigmarchaeota archaeon]|nr:50S ribosomal protein L18 [Candidatus Aenigmarchaeota archaeon]